MCISQLKHYNTPHLSIGVAVGALTCIGHMKPPNEEPPLPYPYGLCSRLLPMLLRGLLSAVSESRRMDVPPCKRHSRISEAVSMVFVHAVLQPPSLMPRNICLAAPASNTAKQRHVGCKGSPERPGTTRSRSESCSEPQVVRQACARHSHLGGANVPVRSGRNCAVHAALRPAVARGVRRHRHAAVGQSSRCPARQPSASHTCRPCFAQSIAPRYAANCTYEVTEVRQRMHQCASLRCVAQPSHCIAGQVCRGPQNL